MNRQEAGDNLLTVPVLSKKVKELEDLVKFVLKWVKIDLNELRVVPEFLRDEALLSRSLVGAEDKDQATSSARFRNSPAPKSVKRTRGVVASTREATSNCKEGHQSIIESTKNSEPDISQISGDRNQSAQFYNDGDTPEPAPDIKVEDHLNVNASYSEEDFVNFPENDDDNTNNSFGFQDDDDTDDHHQVEAEDYQVPYKRDLTITTCELVTEQSGPRICEENRRLNPHVTLTRLNKNSTSTTVGPLRPRKRVPGLMKGLYHWKCKICDQTFRTNRALVAHKSQENHYTRDLKKTYEWKCQKCPKIFPTSRALQTHKKSEKHYMAKKRPKDQWICNICQAAFRGMKELRRHKSKENHYIPKSESSPTNTSNSKWKCHKCSKSFPTVRELHAHRKSEKHYLPKRKSRGEWMCKICKASFTVYKELKRHKDKKNHYVTKSESLANVSNSKWECRKCSKILPTSRALSFHKKAEHGHLSAASKSLKKAKKSGTVNKPGSNSPKPVDWKCDQCREKLPTDEALKCHQISHRIPFNRPAKVKVKTDVAKVEKPPREWKCSKCPATFRTQKELSQHQTLMNHRTNRPKGSIETCEHCGYQTNHKQKFEIHLRVHTGERPYLCRCCGSAFKRTYEVWNHERAVHGVGREGEEERPYQCKYCGRTFKTTGNRTIHENTHEGKSDKICPVCGLSVRKLKVHMREVHEKLRPFACNLCDLKFRRNLHLQRHLRSHGNPNGRRKGLHIDRPERIQKIGRRTVLSMVDPPENDESVKKVDNQPDEEQGLSMDLREDSQDSVVAVTPNPDMEIEIKIADNVFKMQIDTE